MGTSTFSARLRYRFDNLMARGTIALIALLALASALLIFSLSLLVWVTQLAPAGEGGASPGLIEIMWMALMRTLDAGTMGGDAGSWPFLFTMLAVTFGGIFVISTFIGILTSGIESKLDELRKGRSRVIEENHTVILGWGPQVFNIISELVIANQNQKSPCIAVLGPHDKVEMEDALRERVPETHNTRIVCRSGSAVEPTDLDMISVQTSRSIIVLSPDEPHPDSAVVKTVLAITNSPNRRKEPYHIVAEIRDAKNVEAARLVGKNEVEIILVGDLISRITVQTCRQSGLSIVYTELLDFGGAEIYFAEEEKLVGATLAQAAFAYDDSTIIGLFTAEKGAQLLPPLDTRIAAGDKVIAISEDDDTVVLSGMKQYPIDNAAIRTGTRAAPRPERSLILGWNERLPTIVNELDKYVAPGSEVVVVAEREQGEADLAAACPSLSRQKLSYTVGDPTQRSVLEAVGLRAFHHVIVLADETLDVQQADARSLITLLHLRDMAEKSNTTVPIVSEMLDVRNRDLAQVTRADDFIVSDKLIGLMMSQVSENKALNAVFADMFDPEGAEIYLKSVEEYVATGAEMTFYTVLEAARRRGELAIGYKQKAHANDPTKSHGVVTNPKKSARLTFEPGDKIVVVANE